MRRFWFPPIVLLIPLLWLLRRALFAGEMFAFRDSAHYYFPLYKYVQARWRDGLPLWNPLDSIGQPLLGDPTAAVLYPAKLLFCLPCSFSLCFALYVTFHLWLTAYGAFQCAGRFRANYFGALMAGFAYGLSGQVLFQYCNPIFLVGAAWLPWAVICFESALTRGTIRGIVLLAAVLSMMVLGGDPQMAYHFVLIALLRVLVSPRELRLRGMQVIASAAATALLLAAVQILPSYEWAARSDRAMRSAPRSLWEWSARSIHERSWAATDGMWKRTSWADGHAHKIDDFSVGPWRYSELLLPNVSGHWFPVHGRWTRAFPGQSRIWTPSLYLGLLPVALAVFRCRWRTASARVRWLSWLILLSALAGMGEFGLGWLIDELRAAGGAKPGNVMRGFGGVYWLLTVLLPSYASFRYPAKWWTIATLGICLLAAKGWPFLFSKWRAVLARRFGLIAFALLAPVLVTASWVIVQTEVPPNSIFGPFDRSLATAALVRCVLHGVVVVGLLFTLSRNRGNAVAVVLVCVLELCLAQAWMVQTRPASEWQAMNAVGQAECIYRTAPGRAYPESWEVESDPLRFSALQRSDASTLMPKHHLSYGIRSVRSVVCMTSADYRAVWRVNCAEFDSIPNPEFLRVLGVKCILAPENDYAFARDPFPSRIETNLLRFRNDHAFPRAWMVSDWKVVRAEPPAAWGSLLTRTRDVWLQQDGSISDLRRLAIIESDVPIPQPVQRTAVLEQPALTLDRPEHLRISCAPASPAILVLRDQFYPGWEAYVGSSVDDLRRTDLLRVNRVMRGVYVEASDRVVEFRYRPESVFWGAVISLLAWFAGIVVLWKARRR